LAASTFLEIAFAPAGSHGFSRSIQLVMSNKKALSDDSAARPNCGKWRQCGVLVSGCVLMETPAGTHAAIAEVPADLLSKPSMG
jgi:hypothetical protein